MSSSSSSLSSSSLSASGRGLYLKLEQQTRYKEGAIDGFRIKVSAYGETNMTRYVFRLLRRISNVITGEEVDEFDGICSSVDIEELPVAAPVPGQNPPYLRTDAIDLVFRSRKLADDTWAAIKEDVTVLIRSLNVQDTMAVTETVAIGSPA